MAHGGITKNLELGCGEKVVVAITEAILHHSTYALKRNRQVWAYIKKHYPRAKFITEVSLKNVLGGYTPKPALVLHQTEPTDEIKSPYFAIYNNGLTWIRAGLSNWNSVIPGALTEHNGRHYITISRFNDDCVITPCGKTRVFGGIDKFCTEGDVLDFVDYNLVTHSAVRADGTTIKVLQG